MNLVFQILNITSNVIICVNLLDEAKRKGIEIDLKKLSNLIGVPVIGTIAKNKATIKELENTIYETITKSNNLKKENNNNLKNNNIVNILKKSKEITKEVCTYTNKDYNKFTKKIDKIITSKLYGIPLMLLFFGIILWITIIGANYPSQLLSNFFAYIQDKLYFLFNILNSPQWFTSLIIDGVYMTLTSVISVMLPPMAIFFPLFTFLEDLGYLPRIAFNLDKCFKKCCSSRQTSTYYVYGFWL